MSGVNYNYNYENRSYSQTTINWSEVEIASCKKADLDKAPKENGKFYHTTDENEFYYDWNGVRYKLDVKGNANIDELIAQVEEVVAVANSAAQTATSAAQSIEANAGHFVNNDIHVTSTDKSNWNNKQNALSEEQLSAIAAVSTKQEKFDNADVLSGITSAKVSVWDVVAAGSYDVAGSAATALSSAKDYTDEKFAGVSTGVSEGYVNDAISTALDGYAKSSEIPSVSTFVSAGYVDSKVSGLVKSVNGLTGDVNVNTFTDITKKFTTADYISNMSTYQLCKKIQTEINPEPGTAYMAKAILTDYPNSFSGNTGELFIYVPSKGMYIIDMYTTNNFSDKGNTDVAPNDCGKFTTIYDVYYNDGEGKIVELWAASLTCPQTSTSISGQYKYVPTEDWHATSKYYVDNAIAGIVVSGTGVSEEFVNSAISTAMNGVVTESWINNKGYLTEHQSLDGYAKSSEIPSVSGLASEDYVDNAISTASSNYVKKLGNVPFDDDLGKGDAFHIPYNAEFIPGTDKITVALSTINLDSEEENKGRMIFNKELPSATASTAGLMSASDKTKLDDIIAVSLPTTAISSDWESSLPTLSTDGYVKANDVIAFIETAINKKKSEEGTINNTPYAYITGYPINGTPTNITISNPFVLNEEGTTEIEFKAPAEIDTYNDDWDNIEPIRVTMDIPDGYSIVSFKLKNPPVIEDYTDTDYCVNPRGATKTINDVTYNSYVRGLSNETSANGEGIIYKIIIKKD